MAVAFGDHIVMMQVEQDGMSVLIAVRAKPIPGSLDFISIEAEVVLAIDKDGVAVDLSEC